MVELWASRLAASQVPSQPAMEECEDSDKELQQHSYRGCKYCVNCSQCCTGIADCWDPTI